MKKWPVAGFFSIPLLLFLFVDARRILKDPHKAALLLGAASVFGLLMFWHATGAMQRGYNRYSLDYLPALLVLIAPLAIEGRRRWVTVGLIACGVLYFEVLLPMPHIQVWSS